MRNATLSCLVIGGLLALSAESAAVQIRGESARAKNAPGVTRGVATRGVSGRTARPKPDVPRFNPPESGDGRGDCPPGGTGPSSGGSTAGSRPTYVWSGAWGRVHAEALRGWRLAQMPTSGADDVLSGRGRRGGETAVDQDFVHSELVPALQRVVREGGVAQLMAPAVLALGVAACGELAPFALRDVRGALQHEAQNVQMHAAYALGFFGAVDELEALLLDTSAGRAAIGADAVSTNVRAAAAMGLSIAGAGTSALVRVAADDTYSPTLRAATLTALGALPEKATSTTVSALVRRVLTSETEDTVVRMTAAMALGRRGARTALPDLLSLVVRPDVHPWLREAAASAIVETGTLAQPSLREALFKTAETASVESVRAAAWSALGEMTERLQVGELSLTEENALFDRMRDALLTRAIDRPASALALARAVRAHPGRRASMRIVWAQAYDDMSDEMSRVAVAAAGLLADDSTWLTPLIEVVESSNSSTRARMWAAAALANSGSVRARDKLVILLRKRDVAPDLRRVLAQSLADVDADRVRSSLRSARRGGGDPNPIDAALARLRDGETAMRLVRSVESPLASSAVRGKAAYGLARLADADDDWRARLTHRMPVDLRLSALDPLRDDG